jgi:hypothetical protein
MPSRLVDSGRLLMDGWSERPTHSVDGSEPMPATAARRSLRISGGHHQGTWRGFVEAARTCLFNRHRGMRVHCGVKMRVEGARQLPKFGNLYMINSSFVLFIV